MLQAFASGALDQARRVEVATHLATCSSCQALLLPLRAPAPTATFLDSPKAAERRHSYDGLPRITPPPDVALADTHVASDTTTTAVTSLHTGDALDRYVILNRLGSGGMGEVYTAWDPVLDRKVAVKILRGDQETTRLGEELRARMLREAQALARLAHPNVVTIHDVGVMDERVYLAMEFVEGVTLTEWLKKSPRSWPQILDVFLAAGEGLAAAHAVGITHRDFKPDNVVVSTDGRARVMDFGLAHARAASAEEKANSPSGLKRPITDPGTMMGTPAYMSPEAMYGRPTDFRSDEFSFCVALFEALYGERPFAGLTPAAIAAEIEIDRVRAPPPGTRVPQRILDLILKGLRRNPDERFQTMRALLIQLGRRKGSRQRTVVLATLTAFAALSAITAAALVRRDQQRCAGVANRLTGVWDAPTRDTIHRAFLETGKPWAAAASREVDVRLDQYATQWVTLRHGACEAQVAHGNDEALGQTLVCLSRRFADLQAVSELFARADGDVVERAVATASALPPLENCSTVANPRIVHPEREELRGALAAVKARLDAARYGEALTMARALSARASALNEPGVVGEAHVDEAIALMRQGDPSTADKVLEEAVVSATTAGDDETVARAWIERVGAAGLAGLPEAEHWVAFAEAAVSRVRNVELEAALANSRGVLAWARGRYEDAIDAWTRALDLRRGLYGERHLQVARAHSNLGTALKAKGRLDEAVAQYELALSIEREVLDPTHPAVAETLNNLGNALQVKGDLHGARAALEKALTIKEQSFGHDALSVAVTLTNLGALLVDAEDLEGAEKCLTRALRIKEQRNASPGSIAMTLTNLALVRRGQKRFQDSIDFDGRALELRKPNEIEAAFNLSGLGLAEFELGLPRATEHLEAALALRTPQSSEWAATALSLAKVSARTNPTRARTLAASLLATPSLAAAQRTEAEALLKRLAPFDPTRTPR